MTDKVKVIVDPQRCVGSGTCVGIAPRTFVIEGGVAVAETEMHEVSEDLLDAVASCPVEAIRLDPSE